MQTNSFSPTFSARNGASKDTSSATRVLLVSEERKREGEREREKEREREREYG